MDRASQVRRVRSRMARLNLSAAALARMIGGDRRAVHRWIKAPASGVPIEWVRRVADALSMDPKDLLP